MRGSLRALARSGALALALAQAAGAQTPDPDLLIHLKLDETAGATAADAAGGDDNATVVSGAGGATWTDGKRDGGLRCNGLSASGTRYARVPWRSGLVTPSGLTVAAWIRGSQWVNALQCIAGRYTGNTYDWRFWVDKHANHLTFKLGTSTGWQELKAAIGHGGLDTGTWYHVAATWDSTAIVIYLDGAPLASTGTTGAFRSQLTAQPLGIGAKSDGGSWADPFYGTLDDVRVYRRALTQAEIQDLMNGTGSFARLRWREAF